jgi:HAD superfamily hydrolase (TIGR01509 family)
MKYAVIFDMDGVVIDSNPYHKLAWGNFLGKNGLPFNDQIFDNIISGKTGDSTLRALMGKELSEEAVTSYLDQIDGDFQEILRRREHLEPVSGLRQFITAIRSDGALTALATSAPPGNVKLILEKLSLEELFDVVIDRTQVKRGKPDPEIYLKVLEALGVHREHCVVIEDSKAGIQAAIGAGLRVVGITTTLTGRELRAEGAAMVIDHFNNLMLEELVRASSLDE